MGRGERTQVLEGPDSWGTYCHNAADRLSLTHNPCPALSLTCMSCPYWCAAQGARMASFESNAGTNNMQFESDCVFALFDTHHLEDVLKGKMGGSMFGIVQQRDKLLNLSKAGNPHVHNPNKQAEKEGRRAEKLENEEEEADGGRGFSHSHGHNHGHQSRKRQGRERRRRGEIRTLRRRANTPPHQRAAASNGCS